jgi:hypothetical protein
MIRHRSRDDDDTLSVEKLAAEVDCRREGTISPIDDQGLLCGKIFNYSFVNMF